MKTFTQISITLMVVLFFSTITIMGYNHTTINDLTSLVEASK